jgi:hypothetical protein
MRLSDPARATLNDAARLGMLITAVQLPSVLIYTTRTTLAGAGPGPIRLVLELLATLAAAVGFTALNHPRRRRAIAAAAAVLVFDTANQALGFADTHDPGPVPTLWKLTALAALALPLCLLVYVLLGTQPRPRPPGGPSPRREQRRSPWLYPVAVPLACLAIVFNVLNGMLWGAGTGWVAVTVAAGLLYWLMQRRAAASISGPWWLDVTLLVTMPAFAAFLFLAMAFGGNPSGGESPATTIVLSLVGALVGIRRCRADARDESRRRLAAERQSDSSP